jgi:Ribonuclease G/E
VLAVQVARLPDGDKGAKLDGRLPEAQAPPPPGAAAPCLVRRGSDPIAALLRSAIGPELRCVTVDDPATLAALRKAVPEAQAVLELWRGNSSLFLAEGLDEQIDAALSPQVPLPSGGRLVIEETAATVAIDVDTAAMVDTSARAAALACNLEAAAEIGRQIRIRELAGLIVIDFVPMRRRAERERVLTTLRDALAGDERRLRIGGWTRLGLLEIVRERRGPSLLRQLGTPCMPCHGVGIVRDARWVAGEALRAALAGNRGVTGGSALTVSPPVAAMLRGPLATALRDVETRIGRPIALRENASLPTDDFLLEASDVAR